MEVKTLHEYVFEKITLLADMDRGLANRLEMIEKRVFDEPDHVLNYLKKEMDSTKVKCGNDISNLNATLTEDQTDHRAAKRVKRKSPRTSARNSPKQAKEELVETRIQASIPTTAPTSTTNPSRRQPSRLLKG